MELIRPDTNFDFVGKRNIAIIASCLLILAGIVSLVVKGGPAYGIDFAGGTLVQIKFTQDTSAGQIREALQDLDLRGVTIQQFGTQANEFLVRTQESSASLEGLSSKVQASLEKSYGAGKVEVRRTEMVGPQVGKDLRNQGVQALLVAIAGMLVYVSFRFEFRFGVGAVIALAHDVLVTLAAFSLLNREIDLTVVAAFLTIIGYSVNDTVVICDRIRENRGKHPKEGLIPLINRSINETLSRTIMTSGVTLLAVLALYFLGGSVIQNFALAMLIGMVAGVYSTIFIASPVIIYWENFKTRKTAAVE
ncbi:MAG TPA: protein translocase subunit SecF [Desulfuromonadales bacterium]|nr:protein translocase subunit SecF [Desulfuromonadales bacterium]